MRQQSQQVFQFKITLNGISPAIWRRIQVPRDYSFWDLHVAIQDAMGWLDYHLHEFELKHPDSQTIVRIGIPDDDFDWNRETLAGWVVAIADYFTEANRTAIYTYDFGDGWVHKIELERIESGSPQKKYPACIGGERACPPEDVGGVGAYESFLEIMQDPEHEEHEEMLAWVGEEFDPESFDPQEVRFEDPRERWNAAFGEEGDA
jgi:hypothetical protein